MLKLTDMGDGSAGDMIKNPVVSFVQPVTAYYLISTIKYDEAPTAEDIANLESDDNEHVLVHEGKPFLEGHVDISTPTPNIVPWIGKTLYVYVVLKTEDGELHFIGDPEEPFSFQAEINP
ncbi:hypothetical protein [Paenibacillus paeoniae]|uniref:Uncharacterized protein n=1 Tax=Paenibacillus paeoniae TaxID=2292705 RepID=A0A371P7H2_9BACL|nr:hypothetical protein [Paenibacillus paeoniae]REK71872.1 hypothetical protein DX130_19380 [Paenibacillus paeoniae]